MLPTIDDYREYGRRLGTEFREERGPVRDWVGFTETKMNDTLREMRKLAGYSDRYDAGTYRAGDARQQTAYHALINGFRETVAEE